MFSIFEAISGDRPAAAKMNLGLNISAEFPTPQDKTQNNHDKLQKSRTVF